MKLKTLRFFVFVLALSVFIGAAAEAQLTLPVAPATMAGPSGFINSPTYRASMGLFGTGADDLIDATGHANNDFENWYAFASFTGPGAGAFGYAKNFDKVYLGLYYGGTALVGKFAPSTTDMLLMIDEDMMPFKEIMNPQADFTRTNDNRFAVLIGLEDMGFRLSYAANFNSFSDTNIAIPNGGIGPMGRYKSFSRAYGQIVPSFQWGMTKPLSEKGIMPNISVDVAFARNTQESESYGGENTDQRTAANYLEPTVSVGLGSFTLHENDGTELTLDFDYTFKTRLYSTERYWYDEDEEEYRTLSLAGFSVSGGDYEYHSTEHTLMPSLGFSVVRENVGFKAALNLPVSIVSHSFTEMTLDEDYTYQKQAGVEGSEFTLNVNPELLLAVQYRINKLRFNVGGSFNFGYLLGWTTREGHENDEDGNETANSKSTGTVTERGTAGNMLRIGLSYSFSENFTLDAMTSAGNPSNTVNIFGTGNNSLSTFGSIMATIKF